MTANQEMFDRAIQHILDVKRFEKDAAANAARISNEHRTRLGRLLGKNLRTNLRPEVLRYIREISANATGAVRDLSGAELDFQRKNLQASVGKFYKTRKAPTKQFVDSFLQQPIYNDLPLSKNYSNIGRAELSRIESVIKKGIADGRNSRDIISDVRKSSKLSEHQAQTLLRTSVTQVEAQAVLATAEENKEIVEAFEFSAILDNRTSSVCSRTDGTIVRIGDKRLYPPLHLGCRSTLVPILKSKEAMLGQDAARFKKRKLARLSETDFNGAPSAKEDFSAWLRRQPREVKRKHLGSEEAMSLFDEGKLDLKDFFKNNGKPITIQELKLKDAARTFGTQTARTPDVELLEVKNPRQLLNNQKIQRELRKLYLDDSTNAAQSLSLIDYRGVTLGGKRSVRRRARDSTDPRNNTFDPLTGEQTSNLYYAPDFELYQQRVDFVNNSKILTKEQKDFIVRTVDSLEENVSRNQQTVMLENLRLVLERYNKNPEDWGNLANVLRKEMQFSVNNVSKLLDNRSRNRDRLFSQIDDTTSVTIMGDRFSFDELSKSYLKDTRFTNNWTKVKGAKLARKHFYTGKAPLSSYFKLRKKKPTTLDSLMVKHVPGYKQFKGAKKLTQSLVDQYILRNKENALSRLKNNISANAHKMLQLEFDSFINRNKILTRRNDKQEINALSKMFRTVADGTSTDYDGLAINLGKQFYESYDPGIINFKKMTLQDHHALGSKFLNDLVENGMIRVESRGVVRRATIDLDTGRPSSAWKDTVSREVIVLDPSMLDLQQRQRKLVIASRIGITGPENDLIPRRGSLNFFDSQGRDTGVSIITRTAKQHFDERIIDQDVIDFIKKGMSFEYTTDNDFSSFMDRVVRFRDPRGNTKYFDDLNTFRQVILQRGEMGEGLMQTVKWHNARGKPFRARAQIDGRGRLYFNGYLQPTGGETVRPFLNTAKAKQVTPAAVGEIRHHLGALIGDGSEILSNAGRDRVFKRNEQSFLELGRIMTATTQPDRRIREFLEHPLVRSMDGEEVPMLARMALEYTRIYDHSRGNVFDPGALRGYRTQMLGEIDASASAIQMISLATGNRNMAQLSNVMETRSKNRIYDIVAMDTKADPRYRAIEERIGLDMSWEELSKGAKAAVMLAGYGSGRPGISATVTSKLAGVLQKKGFVVTSKAELNAELRNIRAAAKGARIAGADDVADALDDLAKEVTAAVAGEAKAVSNALAIAREYHPDSERFVSRFLAGQDKRISPDDFTQIANVMVDHLEDRAPGARSYIDFWKNTVVKYINETNEVAVPLRTFDDKRWWLRFRPVTEHEVRFWDPKSKRYIKNVYKGVVENDKLLGAMSVVKARTGYGVSFTHANDAAVLRLIYKEAARDGLDISSVHDAVVGNLADLEQMRTYGRNAYATARDAKIIEKTLLEMKRAGMSDKTYRELLQEARELGLLNNEFSSEEITRLNGSGFDYYGWGI